MHVCIDLEVIGDTRRERPMLDRAEVPLQFR
jgi:hypothetical protein